ncbi:DinB family protein [Deinococcus taeanensis]|uniref:DinB family protein n=1 Tax=Deinococcus taeanensis TaxID=2737050 RepID=UPI001CDBE563|nr:DinB family protein [Deinococcus taeanensis]UBV42932.1 DinB family protein [Deinococcus taeanensis]
MNRSVTLARTFQAHRSALLDLYGQLPGEHGTFAAWDGGMSFIGQADHLSASTHRFLNMLQGQAPTPAPAPSASLEEARARLEASQASATQAIAALTDEDLSRRVPAFGGREMPLGALVETIITHEAHHKGQVWLMARMIGVKPPMFIKMG